MSIDVLPILLPHADPPRPDRRIVAVAALSVAVHLLALGLLALPKAGLPPPELTTIDVELVPPEAVSSEPPVPSSQAEASSAEQPSGVQSSEQPPSAEASASEAPPSAEPSAAASVEPSAEPSAEPASEPTAPPPAPVIPRSRPTVTIPVGRGGDPSDPAASAEDDAAPSPDDAAVAPPPPIDKGLLRASKRFYLDAMLDAQGTAAARDALAKLPPEKRLARSCNIEAIGQIGGARTDLSPDALVANAFDEPVVGTTSFGAGNGAVRSKGKWYSVAYECSLSADLSEVTAFAFHVGGDVTAAMEARLKARPR